MSLTHQRMKIGAVVDRSTGNLTEPGQPRPLLYSNRYSPTGGSAAVNSGVVMCHKGGRSAAAAAVKKIVPAEQANQPASVNKLALSSHRPGDFHTHTVPFGGTVLLCLAGTFSLRP